MNKYNIIILTLIVIVVALIIGVVVVMPNLNKQDTNLTFISNSILINGNSINIKLTDDKGIAISNQSINITITDKDNSKFNYVVTTDEGGIGTLKLEQDPGEYTVSVNYGGNGKYSSSNSTQKLTIQEQHVSSGSISSNDYSHNSEYERDYNPNMPGIQNMYRAY